MPQQPSVSIFQLSHPMVPSVMIKMIVPSFEQKSCHMPSLWCLLLLSSVCFLLHHIIMPLLCFIRQQHTTTDVCQTIDPSSMV